MKKVMTVPREQVEYKPEDYGWKPYKDKVEANRWRR